MAPSSQFLRNLRYAVRVPPLSVFWSELRASIVFLPSITWYLSTSAVIGVPTSLLCLWKAELAGARSVYSPPERSMPSLESAAASCVEALGAATGAKAVTAGARARARASLAIFVSEEQVARLLVAIAT